MAGGSGETRGNASQEHEAVPRSAFALVAVLTLFWGINFPMMKLALGGIEPWCFRVACLGCGAAGLFAVAAAGGQRCAVPSTDWGMLALVSLFNITGWHLFSAYGLRLMEAGRAAILAYTMPIWAMLFAWLLLGERPRAERLGGLALGMGGIFVLTGDQVLAGRMPSGALAGALCMLGAAMSWGAGTALLKLHRWGMPTTVLTAWQLLLGGIPVLLGSFVFGKLPDPAQLSAGTWLGLAYSATIPMVACHYAWNRLVGLVPAGVAAIATLLIPVVGVLSSAPLNGERIGVREVAALTLVVAALGVVLILPALPGRRARRKTEEAARRSTNSGRS